MSARLLLPPRWLFFDMNSFFASAEQQDRRELRGRPVGVVPVDTDWTCLIAASIEAKRAGCGMGTSVRQARQTCPDIVIVKARPEFYVRVHHRLLRACDRHAPVTKVYSIDEWSVRLAPSEQCASAATALARRIKRQIAGDVGECLRCSAGVAPTRLLAKIAADHQKPDGLTVLTPDDLPGRLAGYELRDLPGISASMERRLEKAGVGSVAQLWACTRQDARRIWGSVVGEHFWYGLHGVDVPEPTTRRGMVGHSNVLEPRFRDEAGAHGIMVRLLCKAAMRLRYHGYCAGGLQAWVRHECGRVWADQIGLNGVQDTPTVLAQFDRLWQDRRRMLGHLARHDPVPVGRPKKVAVDLVGLVPAATVPPPLFDALDKPLRLSRVMDEINTRHASHAVYFASMHDYRHPMDDKIAFGRLPDEALKM